MTPSDEIMQEARRVVQVNDFAGKGPSIVERVAAALLARDKLATERERQRCAEVHSELHDLVARALLNVPERYQNWHADALAYFGRAAILAGGSDGE